MTTQCNILIVEDELITRQALRYIIEPEAPSFNIVGEACNGKEAQQMIETLQPDIVICDIVMPLLNGIELTKWIKFKFPQIKVIILSSHNDFDYIKCAFKYGITDYILKPALEPEHLLKILYQIKSTFIDASPLAQASIKPASCSYDCFCLIGITPKKLDLPLFYRDIFLEKLKITLKDIDYTLSEVSSNFLLVLINFSKLFETELNQSLLHLNEELLTSDGHLRLGYSPFFTDLTVKEDYQINLEHTFEHQFFIPLKQSPLTLLHRSHQCISSFNEKGYKVLLRSGKYLQALDMLMTFINQLDDTYQGSEFELKTMLENVIYNSFTLLKELQLEIPACLPSKLILINEIDKLPYLDTLKQYFNDLYNTLSNWLNIKQPMDKLMLRQIRKYIQDHSSEPITLYTVAHAFHLSYSYLSSYFNESSPQSFNEFLNEIRITHAKRLLLEGTLSISEISEQVGYTDQSYFSKVFKKLTGLSPSQYKKSLLIQE